jgi:hypothetical protein
LLIVFLISLWSVFHDMAGSSSIPRETPLFYAQEPEAEMIRSSFLPPS